jgi:TetR/AcrR family transcriptional regulator, regulator of cefoperazone and chloramphenicol sensitivity
MRPSPHGQRRFGTARKAGRDHATRGRLLTVAAELFAARGFEHVTIRQICQAAMANVAAVNYHFGDKLGLYSEVVGVAITAMRETGAAVMRGEGSAEDRLRSYIKAFLERIVGDGRASWIHRLMNREMEDPTPELDRVLLKAIRPRLEYLGGLVAELMGCTPSDVRVQRVVASIHGQCLLYGRTAAVSRLAPGWRPTPAAIAELGDHVSDFSLGGIRALAKKSPP